jgi:hypothetical protein
MAREIKVFKEIYRVTRKPLQAIKTEGVLPRLRTTASIRLREVECVDVKHYVLFEGGVILAVIRLFLENAALDSQPSNAKQTGKG